MGYGLEVEIVGLHSSICSLVDGQHLFLARNAPSHDVLGETALRDSSASGSVNLLNEFLLLDSVGLEVFA